MVQETLDLFVPDPRQIEITDNKNLQYKQKEFKKQHYTRNVCYLCHLCK